jgi:hypothetical protein
LLCRDCVQRERTERGIQRVLRQDKVASLRRIRSDSPRCDSEATTAECLFQRNNEELRKQQMYELATRLIGAKRLVDPMSVAKSKKHVVTRTLGMFFWILFHAGNVLASHQPAAGSFSIQRLAKEPGEQLPENKLDQVKMRCFSDQNGHRIIIVATNTAKNKVVCSTRCFYRTSSGLAGMVFASAVVPPGISEFEVHTEYFSQLAVELSSAGSFICSEP